MPSLSAASNPRRPRVGQAVWIWPRSPQVKQRSTFVLAGLPSTISAGRVVGRELGEEVVVSRVVEDLESSDVVVLRVHEFPVH